MATGTVLPKQLTLKRKVEALEMDRITDCLCIDGIESRINAGADKMQVGEVIIRSPQYLKAHLVATNGEGGNFGGFVCP